MVVGRREHRRGACASAIWLLGLAVCVACSRTGLDILTEVHEVPLPVPDVAVPPPPTATGPNPYDAAIPDVNVPDSMVQEASPPPNPGDAWRQLGHDGRHSGRSLSTISADPQVLWKFTADGWVGPNIVIDEAGRSYFLVEDPTKSHNVTVLNADGTLSWQTPYQIETYGLALEPDDTLIATFWNSPDIGVEAFSQDPGKRFTLHLLPGPSPCRAMEPTIGPDGTIYFVAWTDYGIGKDAPVTLYAVSPQGTLSWSVVLGHGGTASSPAVDDSGFLYVAPCFVESTTTATCQLSKLDPSGKVLWTKPLPSNGGAGAPVVSPTGSLIVATGASSAPSLFSFTATGDLMWSKGVTTGVFANTPAVDKLGRVYAGSVNGLWLFSAGGAEIWNDYATAGVGTYSIWLPVALSADDALVFSDAAGYLGAIRNGKVNWYVPFDPGNAIGLPLAIGPHGTIVAGRWGEVDAFR